MTEIWTIAMLIFASLLWGITNPMLKKGSEGIESIKAQNYFYQFFSELKFLASRLNYVGPFLLNQLGGLLFIYSLGHSDLSLAVPLTNSLTFIITSFTGHFLGEETLTQSGWIGMAFVCAGISLCVADKTNVLS